METHRVSVVVQKMKVGPKAPALARSKLTVESVIEGRTLIFLGLCATALVRVRVT